MTGRLLSVVLGSLIATSATAAPTNDLSNAEIEGRQLAQQLCNSQPATNFVRDGLLIIRDGNGRRSEIPVRFQTSMASTMWSTTYEVTYGSNHLSLVVVHENGKPNQYEFFKGSPIFISIPQLLNGNKTMIPFAGSDFWIADLGLEFFHWPEQKILKHEMRRGRPCKVLESTNPNPSPGGYSRVVSWIDNETLGLVQAEAYDTKGELLKEFYPKSFKKINGQWELQEMEIRNDQTGSRTRLEFNLRPTN